MQKIYLTWSKWYFWSHINNHLASKYEIIPWTIDVRNHSELKKEIITIKPDIIINTAWKTGKPNVDWCESNKEETIWVNVSWAINVATIASELWIYCVQIWSWCIFEWNNKGKWFSEEDEANFSGSFYSRTKAISEKALIEFPILQLRVRIPIEWKSCSKNVIDKLLKYQKIISVENSFTIIEDFLLALEKMIVDKITWIYNMTNIGSCDHEYIMTKYKEIVDNNFEFKIMSLDELKQFTCAWRSNCILNTDKRESQWYHMPEIKWRIPVLLEQYKNS